MKNLKAIIQAVVRFGQWARRSFVVRVITGVSLGVLVTYLFAVLSFCIYVVLRRAELEVGPGSASFMIGFFVIGFLIASEPILDSVFSAVFRPAGRQPGQVSPGPVEEARRDVL